MKLRLPLPLFRALISATVAACACTAEAAILYSGISIATYTDFGQNMGRYRVYETNALLNYLNQDGVQISYLDGSPDYTLLHGMISFESQNDGGYAAAIGYNFIATVEHNSSFDSTFTSRYIGWDNAIKYSSIECLEMKSQWTNSDVFALGPEGTDHRISRQSKLITDVAPSTVFRHEGTDVGPATEKMLYRAGSGTMYWMDSAWQMTDYAEPYVFITGGIVTSTGGTWKVDGKEEGFETYTGINWSSAVSGANPMPYAPGSGDSGSPVYIWNEATGQYEYYGSTQAGNVYNSSNITGDYTTQEKMDAFNVDIAPGSGVGTIYLNAVKEQGETLTDSFGNSGTLWHGSVTWVEGDAAQSVQYNGVQSGLNTWKSLGDYLDKGNWYAYGTDMLALPDTDLFYTSNLVFSADAGQHIDINLTGSVDLGVGYLEFRRNAEETDSSPAVFTIASASSEDGTAGDYQLDAAGYVIGAGVEVYLQLKGDTAHVAEWRKTGEGDLHLQGSGENTILLNLGGSGTTYLEYTGGGYAAYNVLANTGTTVVLADTGQIKRDFTFGNGGATLDLNGNSMAWNNDAAVEADGFTIHALTEDAIIANKKAGTTSTLTWTQGGEQTYLGSFQDGSAAGGGESGLRFIYDPGAGDATLTWHSIHTSLTGHDSGMTVNGGTLRLVGSNTVHAIASAGSWTDRLFRADDWHYADAAASVTINAGGTFELGSHARLTGDVYVKNGGTLLMREGVQQQYEYVEGWYFREDTYALADFYGLKGNVILEEGAAMRVEYSEGTTANTTYGGSLSGSGSLTVATGDGTLSLSGDNRAFTGSKEVVSGGLIATDNKALGDFSSSSSSGWLIREGAWLASHGFTEAAKADILTYIDTASEGVLALTSDISYLDLSRHASLVIGAWEGAEGGVHYGTANAELAPCNGQWVLGGGGGTLYVDFRLAGDYDLVLGNGQSRGTVVLTNPDNSFTGTITLSEGMTLLCTDDAALGNATLSLGYTRRASLSGLGHAAADSAGIWLVDGMSGNATLDLRGHTSLALGSGGGDVRFSGNILVGEGTDTEAGQAYRFSAAEGTLTVETPLGGAHDVMVDAQGYSGGTVVLANVSDLSGSITVRGHDAAYLGLTGGDIILRLAQDNVLGGISGLRLEEGGTLDIGTGTQTIKASLISGSGTISSQTGGTLRLDADTKTELDTGLDVDKLVVTGDAPLYLSSSAGYGTLLVEGGLLGIEEGYVPRGDVQLSQGGAVALNSTSVSNNFTVVEGTGYLVGSPGASNESGTDYWSTSRINGLVEAAPGTTLVLQGECLFLGNDVINGSGGVLEVQTTERLDIGRDGDNYVQKIGGTVRISAEGSTVICSNAIGSNMGREFNHIDILPDSTLVLSEKSWNTIWNIHSLTGGGELVWNSTTTHSYTSRLVLDGENDVSAITLNRQLSSQNWNGQYHALLELAHDGAARGAVVTLAGSGASATGVAEAAYAVLALNTDNAHMAGLSGNGYAYMYAGAAVENSSSAAPVSTRAATLTLTGSGEYTYQGAVAAGADGAGVHLVMEGTGTQVISGGDSVHLLDVAALAGTLDIRAGADIAGNATVARGAALQVEDGYTLDAGKTLYVVAGTGDASTASAVLGSGLELNGGTIDFDSLALGGENAALDLGGSLTLGSGSLAEDGSACLVVGLTNAQLLQAGVTYKLASGDWSGLEGNIITTAVFEYMTPTFSASRDGLTLTFSMNGEGRFIDLSYTKEVVLPNTEALQTGSAGVLLLNQMPESIDLSQHASLALGVSGSDLTYAGEITLAEGQAYRFSAEQGVLTVASPLEGTRDIIVDAQTHSGGTVVLDLLSTGSGSVTELTGHITVRGHDTEYDGLTGGAISLRLAQDNALGNISGLRLEAGGTLDIGTGTQTIKTSLLSGSGTISSQTGGTLRLDVDTEIWLGIGLDVDKLVVTGDSPLYLSSSAGYGTLLVEGGLLVLAEGYIPHGAVQLSQGGTVDLNRMATTNNFSVVEGTGFIVGTEIITGSATNQWTASRINGLVDVAEGAELELKGGCISFSNAHDNMSGGTIVIALDDRLDLARDISNDEQRIGGTLAVRSGNNATILTNGRVTDLCRTLDHLNVEANASLTLDEFSNNTHWTVHQVSGEGDIRWTPFLSNNGGESVTQKKVSSLVLDGEGTLTGSFTMATRSSQVENRSLAYASVLELAHDNALQGAELILQGDTGGTASVNSQASLAINTGNAHLAGLSGNAASHLYAGASMGSSGDAAPVSTRAAILTLTGSGDYLYEGTVAAAGNGQGLSIRMEGSGRQRFTQYAALQAAQVSGGKLAFGGGAQFGEAEIEAHGSLTVSDILTMTQSGDAVARMQATLSAPAPDASTPDASGSGISIRGDAGTPAASVENMLLSLAEGASLGLEEVTIQAGSIIQGAGSGATLRMGSGVTLALAGNNTARSEQRTAAATTLVQSGHTENTLTMKEGASLLAITTDMLGNVTLEGASLTLDLTAMGELSGYDYLTLSFGSLSGIALMDLGGGVCLDYQGMSVTALTTGGSMAGYVDAANPGILVFEAPPATPEPGTATLGLLALAALCSRRRRGRRND